jgi:hypothetical protein
METPMKHAALGSLALGLATLSPVMLGVAAPAWAEGVLPRPDGLRWECGRAAMTTIAAAPDRAAAEFTVVTAPSVRWDFSVPGAAQAVVGDAVARAVGTRAIVAVGYAPAEGYPRPIDGVAHLVRVGDPSIGCTALKADAQRAYARLYDDSRASAPRETPAPPHPKIKRLKTWR